MKFRSNPNAFIALALLASSPVALADRNDYETPQYEVVVKDGSFEVRDYPAIRVASVTMKSEAGRGDSAFMRLFGYISGKNEDGRKIAMTTPVINSSSDGQEVMSFVIPKAVAEAGAPGANDPGIVVSERTAGRFAVYRYSGRWTEANETAASKKLMRWVEDQGLSVEGSVERASYDPPFTLPVLRRNEVMVRIGG